MSSQLQALFTQPVLNWFAENGRHDLPWQKNITPYRVWVSEIMLQQTQVTTVLPYYQRFMARFPQVTDLALATQDDVLSHWSGLGYYARGRNLHKAAQQIVEQHRGEFPRTFDEILTLPGVGRSTAGAILAISLNQRASILDGNVKRVLSRFFAVEGWPGEKKVENALWKMADELTPEQGFADYTQAIMDMGATLCKRTKPLCDVCPVQQGCKAFAKGDVTRFPFSKPKKTKPVKKTWMLIMTHRAEQVFLCKRPQKGIWAGLWSLPEFESKEELLRALNVDSKVNQSLVEWEPFRHTFSHYHLDIHPIELQNPYDSLCDDLNLNQSRAEECIRGSDWFVIKAVLEGNVGVAAPITKMAANINKRVTK